jgi:hypothetical protein
LQVLKRKEKKTLQATFLQQVGLPAANCLACSNLPSEQGLLLAHLEVCAAQDRAC